MSGIPRGFANMYQLLEITPTVAYTTTNTRSIIDFEVATPNYLRT
jgi:dTDP-4-dehydrorhamnose 3,5-epimerase-like enzyme